MKNAEFIKIVDRMTKQSTNNVLVEVVRIRFRMIHTLITNCYRAMKDSDIDASSVAVATIERMENFANVVAMLAERKGVDVRFVANETLGLKASEYAMNEDRLWNFKPTYLVDYELDKKESLIWSLNTVMGYMLKHYNSVMDIETGKLRTVKGTAKEKYGDLYNYCILAIAIAEEYMNENNN